MPARRRRLIPETLLVRLPRLADFDDLPGVRDFGFGRGFGDLHDKGAAGLDAPGGLCLGHPAEAGIDAVEQREVAGLDRAQLPDSFQAGARLERAEIKGLVVRGGAAAGSFCASKLGKAFGEDPDGSVGLGEFGLGIVDGEGQR